MVGAGSVLSVARATSRMRSLFCRASVRKVTPVPVGHVSAGRQADTCPLRLFRTPVDLRIGVTHMHDRIDRTVVAITGASSGIGAATAEHLAALGAAVVLGARREDRVKAVVDRIATAGGTATGIVVDVTKRN